MFGPVRSFGEGEKRYSPYCDNPSCCEQQWLSWLSRLGPGLCYLVEIMQIKAHVLSPILVDAYTS